MNWKILLKKRVILKHEFALLSGQGLTSQDSSQLASIFFQSLSDPDFPMPAFNREAKSFLTIFQNFLSQMTAGPSPDFYSSQGSELLESLYYSLDEMKNQVKVPEIFQELEKIRWVALQDLSYSRFSANPSAKVLIFQLIKCMIKGIKLHCKGTAAVLREIKDLTEFVSEYCCRVRVM